jgi:hypothetical protein
MFCFCTSLGNVCEDGYAFSANLKCSECGDSTLLIPIIILCLLPIIIITVFINHKCLLAKFDQIKKRIEKATEDIDIITVRNKSKILVAFLQIVTSMPTTLNLVYPYPFNQSLDILSFAKFDFISLFSLGCVFPSDFYVKLRYAFSYLK